MKTCIVCKAEFAPISPRHLCCSPECSKERKRSYNREYGGSYKKKRKAQYRKHSEGHTVCRICGEPTAISSTGYKTHYHDECVLYDCAETLKRGEKLTNTQYNRASSRGYTMQDIREALEEVKDNE